jgi:Flp pilus assembly protein TadG
MRDPRSRLAGAACDGMAAIEFALLAPTFLGLVFGTIEYGRLLWTEQALQQTAIAGARCMAIAQGTIQSSPCASSGSYSATSTQTYIKNIASGWGLSVPTANITLNNAATCGGTTGFSQVTLTNTFNTAVPAIVLLAAGGTTLTATACYPNNPF